jgi:hypothetical protein
MRRECREVSLFESRRRNCSENSHIVRLKENADFELFIDEKKKRRC